MPDTCPSTSTLGGPDDQHPGRSVQRGRRPELTAAAPIDAETHEGRRCSARSSRTGEPCRKAPVLGARVCRSHGAGAPQVKAKAEERLAAMVDPALTQLAWLMEWADSDGVKLAAVKDVLDRAGFAAKQRVEFTLRTEAKRLAEELGLSEAEVLAEAERIVRGVEAG